MTILVIAAHPDDEVLGCGGTMARAAQEGHDVQVAILGEGISSRHGRRAEASPAALQELQEDARAAAAALGASHVWFGGLPDNRFDEVPLLDIIKLVEARISACQPAAIYTHHPGDLNIDHGLTFRAVLTATRPGASQPVVPDLYAFEVPSSTEWAFQRVEPVFRPSVFVDIASSLERKIAAMQCYRSERCDPPHPRSPEMLRAAAGHWGSVAGMRCAEAFELIRSLRPRPHVSGADPVRQDRESQATPTDAL